MRHHQTPTTLSWPHQTYVASSYLPLPSILFGAWIDPHPGKSCWSKSELERACCESGRWREECAAGGIRRETGSRWRSRMTAGVEGTKTRWLGRRGSADRSINIPTTACQTPYSAPFLFFLSSPNWWCARFERNTFSFGKYKPKLCRGLQRCDRCRERWWKL